MFRRYRFAVAQHLKEHPLDIVEGELNTHANYNGWTQHELEAGQDYLRALHSDPNAAPPPTTVLSTNKANVVKSYMDRYAGVS